MVDFNWYVGRSCIAPYFNIVIIGKDYKSWHIRNHRINLNNLSSVIIWKTQPFLAAAIVKIVKLYYTLVQFTIAASQYHYN